MAANCIISLLVVASLIVLISAKADNARLQKIKPWDIELKDNGYSFLVGISDDVPVSKAEKLIEKLEQAITKASETLHKVTRRRSSFTDVTIVVPNSWENLGHPLATGGESVDKGNFYVYTDSMEAEPFVLKYFKGSQSERGSRSIMLHDDFLIEKGNSNDIGQKIIEEWITLRYGLEVPFSKFVTDIDQTNDCVDGAQNSVCEGLQADITEWNSAVKRPNAQPNFTVVRQRKKRIVVVLDVSGSMSFRMTKARQGIIRYFEHLYDLTLDDETKANTLVAAVKFSTKASSLGNLSFVTSDEFDILGSQISLLEAEEKTSIGAGLLAAMEILDSHPEGKMGAEIILISDGVEDTAPFMNETWDEYLQSKVVVHTIGFSENADSRVDALAAATGGLSFIHNDGDSGNDLEQAFLSISDYENSDPAATGIVIFSVRQNRTTSMAAYNLSIDALLARNVTFNFECTLQNCIKTLRVTFVAPDNRTLMIVPNSIDGDFKKTEYSVNRNQSRIAAEMIVSFPHAMPGIWKIKTERVFALGTTITAYPSNPGQYPILAFCFWGIDRVVPNQTKGTQTMNALVTRGNSPVTGANVTACVQNSGKTNYFQMRDDGEGGDLYKDDGIYTARFLKKNFNFTRDERYSFTAKVDGTPAAKVRPRQLVGVSPARSKVVGLGSSDDEPVVNFQRNAIGGTFMSIKQEGAQTIPDPITDFKATVHNHFYGGIIFTWTAPYDPLYSASKLHGSRYEIRYGFSEEGVMKNWRRFDSGPFFVEYGSLRPSEEGTNEKLAFVARYSGWEHTMYFTIVTVRPQPFVEVRSDPSNIVRVTLIRCNPNCRRGKCIAGISSCQCEQGFRGRDCELLDPEPSQPSPREGPENDPTM